MSERVEHVALGDDGAAYVLGALEDHEAVAFRAHADSCEVCRAELERLTQAASLIPLGITQLTAPKRLRRRVLREAAGDAHRSRARERGAGSRSFFARPALAGGVALAAGVALGAVVFAPGAGSTSVIRASVASAAVWHTTSQPVAVLDRDGNRGQLVVSNLPSAGSAKVYEVWIERDDVTQPTDVLFEPTSSGHASVDVPGDLNGASAVLVTAERQGGATVPSTAPLIVARLSV